MVVRRTQGGQGDGKARDVVYDVTFAFVYNAFFSGAKSTSIERRSAACAPPHGCRAFASRLYMADGEPDLLIFRVRKMAPAFLPSTCPHDGPAVWLRRQPEAGA